MAFTRELYRLGFEISPVILCNGVAEAIPGGMLPSPGVVRRQAAGAGLVVSGDLAFGADYAETLVHWHRRFEAALPAVRELRYDERFVRLWRFYLAYCEAGFNTGDVDVHHYVFAHADGGRAP